MLSFQGYRDVLGFKGLSRINGRPPTSWAPPIDSTVPLSPARDPVAGWRAISPELLELHMNEINSKGAALEGAAVAGADAGAVTEAKAVFATLVPEADRMDFLPTFFGTRLMLRGEAMVYGWMRELCAEYDGGMWSFFTLSNGGGYLAPSTSQPMKLEVDGNGFEGTMSADAAGIVATFFTLSHLSMQTEQEALSDLFLALREFAAEHAEAGLIFGAID